MCNQTIKFGTFAALAFAQGADFVSTGHYGRIQHNDDGSTYLMRACDEHKDQTYFMWRVKQDIFARTLLPVGDFSSKDEVRRACAERGLGVENKPDSDGICFVGPVGIRTFLLDSLDRRAGDIVEWETGHVLGQHDGAFLFTVGQRRGLDLGGGPAHYVVHTDTQSNTVYVTADKKCPALWTRTLRLSDMHWISEEAPVEGTYLVRTRHTGDLREARLVRDTDGMYLDFPEPIHTVAPGQSAVLYEGKRCLGGALIEIDERFLS